jgi:ubiquinone/menaquinone biosynthesis C-methylase UbiE
MSSKADRFAAMQAGRVEALRQRLGELVATTGGERALDVGTGTGALAFALAPLVGRVVGVDIDAAMLERARADAPPNVALQVAHGERLPFPAGSFDLGCTLRTLHHTRHPELLLTELGRVVRPGGTVLVVDQLAPDEPAAAEELNRFERARDGSTTTVLAAAELRVLFEASGLAVVRAEVTRARRDLDRYLDLAGCAGAEREHARALAPAGYEDVTGWYVLRS